LETSITFNDTDKAILQDIRCCVCNNEDINSISFKYRKENFIVVECNKCSFIFVPQYFSKKISYEDYKDEKVLEQVRKGNNWLKIQRHLLRFKLIRKYKPSGKLFDLGTGWGHFLFTGKQLGYEVSGIEVSDTAYKYATEELKLPVEHINFFDMGINKQAYDLITMWDVLEHIPDADEVIKRCNLMLKDGGYVILQVPQIDSLFAKRLKENWHMISYGHVNYFSKDTIRKLFERHGFEVKKIKSSFEFKLFLMYVLGKKKTSESDKQEYFNKTADKPMWMLKIMVVAHDVIYNIMSSLGIGDEMMVVAKKIK
jgi:2-polyprenyl-3-methyl-5-hydroxy-6-metoxy-1,4-benzoquinol methylase